MEVLLLAGLLVAQPAPTTTPTQPDAPTATPDAVEAEPVVEAPVEAEPVEAEPVEEGVLLHLAVAGEDGG